MVPVWYSYSEVVMGRGVPWLSVFLGEKMRNEQNCWARPNSSFKRGKAVIPTITPGCMIRKLSTALAVEVMR